MTDKILSQNEIDLRYMKSAYRLAKHAASLDEVPVGCIIVKDGTIIAGAANRRETNRCATHHAEILAIEEACKTLDGWRLPGCTLYVSLEPCPMCAGAIANARIERVVFGAYDPKGGAYGSVVNLAELPLNHKPTVEGGVMESDCRELLTSYFRGKRQKNLPEA